MTDVLGELRRQLRDRTDALRGAGTFKRERVLESPQGTHLRVAGRAGPLLNLCANNYLGLADHPALVDAAKAALDRWGLGAASVRFICGTQSVHKELEDAISAFLGTEDTILYGSCFDANAGLFETLLDDRDAVISDELNHASIIDGVRLCRARRLRYRNADLGDLEDKLRGASSSRYRMIATDGVFSMDGAFAPLDGICELAGRYGAIVMVDDSHATGFVGPTGRGTPELFGVTGRVDVLTGTLGKALGGASGGFASGRAEIVELLRQRSRPYLFSNTLAPPIAAASIAAVDLLSSDDGPRRRLWANTEHLRRRFAEARFEVPSGTHPIVPVMIHDAAEASRFADRLLDEGVYAIAFSYPVVPEGRARIRTQVSAVHTTGDLDRAVDAFMRVRERT